MDKAHNALLARVGTALYQQVEIQQADLDAVYNEIEALIAKVECLRAEALGQRAEASYLRACVPPVHPSDYGHEVWATSLRDAVAAERAAVVAWLRDNEDAWSMPTWQLADHIERGEHRREEEG